MPVTFTVDPSKKPERSLASALKDEKKSSVQDYLNRACPNQMKICQEILQSSFGESARGGEKSRATGAADFEKMMKIRRGGLTDVAVEAYNRHYHLVLRYSFIEIKEKLDND